MDASRARARGARGARIGPSVGSGGGSMKPPVGLNCGRARGPCSTALSLPLPDTNGEAAMTAAMIAVRSRHRRASEPNELNETDRPGGRSADTRMPSSPPEDPRPPGTTARRPPGGRQRGGAAEAAAETAATSAAEAKAEAPATSAADAATDAPMAHAAEAAAKAPAARAAEAAAAPTADEAAAEAPAASATEAAAEAPAASAAEAAAEAPAASAAEAAAGAPAASAAEAGSAPPGGGAQGERRTQGDAGTTIGDASALEQETEFEICSQNTPALSPTVAVCTSPRPPTPRAPPSVPSRAATDPGEGGRPEATGGRETGATSAPPPRFTWGRGGDTEAPTTTAPAAGAADVAPTAEAAEARQRPEGDAPAEGAREEVGEGVGGLERRNTRRRTRRRALDRDWVEGEA